MRKIRHIITFISGVTLVGGCQTYADRPFFDPLNLQVEMQPRVPKTAQVIPSEQSLVLKFPNGEYELTSADRDRAAEFLMRRATAPSDEILLDFGIFNAPAELSNNRRVSLAELIVSAGLDPASVKVRTNIRGINEDEVNLTIKSYLVTLPGCPDFTSRAGRTFDNRPHSNWGCATASNIGLMVDEPRDLLIGRGGTPADAEALVLSTQRYRAGETRSLDVGDSNTAEAFVASGGGGQGQ